MTIDVARLPRRELAAGTRLFRIHPAGVGPWLFSGDKLGRFNPVAVAATGASYWAEDPLGAWVEKFRTRMDLSETEVRLQAVSVCELASAIEVVDLTDRRSLAAGVTMAVTTGADYTVSQEIASGMPRAASGVRWRVRHDPAQQLIGVVLLGPRGAQPGSRFGATTTGPVERELIRAAEDAFGYVVLPVSAR